MRVSHRRARGVAQSSAGSAGTGTHDWGVAKVLRQEFGVGIGGRCHGGMFEHTRPMR